eukprot:TRINITY_DN30203_c0_g7_i2.p3 TRINITY_DN30203_c0_g7~~TRINITY_DN30203_c0_g7_i2.p3  ORF type:complete len:126 (+),score=5.58 TRINITY_DN30203_c0_g7_i2:406-783(+)
MQVHKDTIKKRTLYENFTKNVKFVTLNLLKFNPKKSVFVFLFDYKQYRFHIKECTVFYVKLCMLFFVFVKPGCLVGVGGGGKGGKIKNTEFFYIFFHCFRNVFFHPKIFQSFFGFLIRMKAIYIV